MSKRIAQVVALGLAAPAALVLGGSALGKGAAGPTITSMSPTWGARGTTVVIHGVNLERASVEWASACDPGAQGAMATKAMPIRATVNPPGTQITFSVPDGRRSSHGIAVFGGPSRIAVTTPAGAVSATFTVTSPTAL